MSLPSLYIFSHIFSISDVRVLSIHFNHKKNSKILLSMNQRNKQRHAHHINKCAFVECSVFGRTFNHYLI